MKTHAAILSVLSGAGLLGGCTAVQPRESFASIESNVSERLKHRVHWNTGGEADKAVAREVDSMLAEPLNVDSAIQIALLNNRNLQSVYEELGIAQAELVEAGLLKNPVFDGSIRFAEGGGSSTLDLGIVFDFLDIFFVGMRKDIAAAELESAKANVSARVLDLAGETKVAFLELVAAQQIVEMRQQVERASAASYDLTVRLREAGNNRPLDVANEQALLEESRLALAAAEADVVEKRENLNRLMGTWGTQTSWTIVSRLPEPSAEPLNSENLERRAIEHSLDLEIARAEILTSRRRLGITKPLGYLSDLEVGATAERSDGEWEVGPSVSLPIPIFSQGQPAVARAQAELRSAEQRFYARAVEIRSTVRAAFSRVQSLRQRAEHYRNVLLPLRQSIVDDTQLQYNAMQVGAFQLLRAKRDQIEAANEYLNILRDYWIAHAQLEQIFSGRVPQSVPTASAEASPARSNTNRGH